MPLTLTLFLSFPQPSKSDAIPHSWETSATTKARRQARGPIIFLLKSSVPLRQSTGVLRMVWTSVNFTKWTQPLLSCPTHAVSHRQPSHSDKEGQRGLPLTKAELVPAPAEYTRLIARCVLSPQQGTIPQGSQQPCAGSSGIPDAFFPGQGSNSSFLEWTRIPESATLGPLRSPLCPQTCATQECRADNAPGSFHFIGLQDNSGMHYMRLFK